MGPGVRWENELLEFNRYMERVSTMMRNGEPFAQLLVYLPLEDNFFRGPLPRELRTPAAHDYWYSLFMLKLVCFLFYFFNFFFFILFKFLMLEVSIKLSPFLAVLNAAGSFETRRCPQRRAASRRYSSAEASSLARRPKRTAAYASDPCRWRHCTWTWSG